VAPPDKAARLEPAAREELVRKERLGMTKKFFKGAPDLAAEILSPEDTGAAMHKKLLEYFADGTRLAWVVDPENRSVLVYRSPDTSTLLRAGDYLDGQDILPGFTFPVSDLFEVPNFRSQS